MREQIDTLPAAEKLKIRNQISAQQSRDKVKELIKELQQEVTTLKEENSTLQKQNLTLQKRQDDTLKRFTNLVEIINTELVGLKKNEVAQRLLEQLLVTSEFEDMLSTNLSAGEHGLIGFKRTRSDKALSGFSGDEPPKQTIDRKRVLKGLTKMNK